MTLKQAIDTKEGVMLRLTKGEISFKLTFYEHTDISKVFSCIMGEFVDLGMPTKDRPYRYYKEVYFFETDEELPIKVDFVFSKGNPVT